MIVALIGLWLTLIAARGTPIGKAMHRWMVEAPARWLGRFTRGQLLLLAVMVAGGAVMMWLLEEEGLQLMAMYSPELLGLLASVEFTAAIDAVAATLVAASAMRFSMVRTWVRMRMRGGTTRARRTQRIRRPGSPANDEDGPALLLCAA